jgi:hypothetical protein
MGQGGAAAAVGTLVASRYATWVPSASPVEIAAISTVVMWSVTVLIKYIRDRLQGSVKVPPVAIVLIVLLMACAGQTPRQKFYYAEVAFSGAQSASVAYLRTPYGQAAPESVLTAISETSDEGTLMLKRLRPLLPAKGEETPDLNIRLLDAGLDTMQSIIERLNRTVFAPEMYLEE